MRLSVIEQDPGYAAWCSLGDKRHNVDVFLDGDLIRLVITVDDEMGIVVVYQTDLNGEFVVDAKGDAVHQVLFGNVRIFIRENA